MLLKIPLLYVLLSFSFITLGQESSREYSRFYADVDVGFGLWNLDAGNANTHFALGGGYRFTSQFAIGADYRSVNNQGAYNSFRMKGVGGSIRYTHKWMFLKASIGKVLSSEHFQDNERMWDFLPSGQYLSITAGYHFDRGLLLGLSFSSVSKLKFDQYSLDDFMLKIYDGQVTKQYYAVTLTIGYAWRD